MRFNLRFPAALFLGAASLSAQNTSSPQPGTQSAPISTLSTGTQLVVVDVVVQDHDGHPIHGLKAADFRLDEDKSSQAIRSFDEHSAALPTRLPPAPRLPPGTFTNYSPVGNPSALNVLLLDSLNTPTRDQAYVRNQLKKFVDQSPAGTRIAIFGLAQHLILLQGFTSDPAILRAAVDHKPPSRQSILLPHPNGINSTNEALSDQMADIGADDPGVQAALSGTVASLRQFEASNSSFQTQLRTRYTLDAFNQLAHYLAALPGRKNLIWFSESFPISAFPNGDLQNPFDVIHDNSPEYRETTNLLARARVAVYPVDAHEVLNAATFNTPNNGTTSPRDPRPEDSMITQFDTEQATAHATMEQMATDTGGRAFYDGGRLLEAVEKSIDSGQNFYTLTYAPFNRNWTGEYRHIAVQLQGEAGAHRGIRLFYRHGYYADDPRKRPAPAGAAVTTTNAAAAALSPSDLAYGRAAMQHGAPTPSEIPFTVRVLPASTTTQDKPFAHNSPNPNGTFKGPYRLFNLDIGTLASNLDLPPGPDGIRHGSVEFITYVYDTEGRLLNTESSTVKLDLKPDIYKALAINGFGCHQQVSVPENGESFLRIAIHDTSSGHFGAVEVPISAVRNLPLARPGE